MTDIETAGLVLATISLLLSLLDIYKDRMKRNNVFFKRKKHIKKLSKALLMQKMLFIENVQTLLLRIEIDNIPKKSVELFELFNDNNEIRKRIEYFLDKETYTLYINIVLLSERIVRHLIKSFKTLNSILNIYFWSSMTFFFSVDTDSIYRYLRMISYHLLRLSILYPRASLR